MTLEFSEELGWFNECVCGVNEWCEQHGEWVHGEWIDGDVDVGTDVQPGDETQVSYQSSTATLKDVDEEERRSDHGFNGGDLCV